MAFTAVSDQIGLNRGAKITGNVAGELDQCA
jgi:hypothetical protein